jgi:hypothetical protein
MRKTINKEHVEGRVYEHNLALKTVQNRESANFGKEFIGGTLDIATDEDCLNIVTINFTYVTETTAKGNKNETFTALKTIIESGKTVLVDGKDAATMVKVDTALGVNDFYTNRNGQEELVTAKRNDGGFVHIVNKLCDEAARSTFECDMLINGTRVVEKDEERKIPEDYLIVKGAVFNFRNELQPVEFVIKNPDGIAYFESLDASPSNLVFTKVWGLICSETIKTLKEEESAFGESVVKEYERKKKEWVITGTAKETYEIDDEQNGITMEEVTKALANREVYLAGVKKKQDEYQASKNNVSTSNVGNVGVTAAQGGFNF